MMAAHWFIYEMGADPTFAGGANPTWDPLIYEYLFAYDPIELKKGNFKVVPWVAESYTMSDDGLEYTIKIRKGIKFHHTGNELTAEDVDYMLYRSYFWVIQNAYPMDIVKAQDIPYVPFKVINKTEVLDTYTIKIYLNEPFPALPEFLAGQWSHGILDKEACEAHAKTGAGGLSDHGYSWLMKGEGGFSDAGSGPYMVKEFTLLQKYVLERYDDYWGGPAEYNLPKPAIKTITILAIIEDMDARMKMMKGELDIASDLLPDTLKFLEQQPGIKGDLTPGNTYQSLEFHCFRGYLKDWRVRKAIKMALDYDSYAEDIMLGTGTVAQGFLIPGQPKWEETARYFPGKDYDGANALLDAAGYPKGPDGWRFDVELMVRPVPRYGTDYIMLASAIKSDLANIGVNVKIAVYEVGEYYSRIMDLAKMEEFMWIQPGHVPILTDYYYLPSNPRDPLYWYGWNSTSQGLDAEGRDLFQHYCELYDDANAELDMDKRLDKFIEVSKYFLELSLIHI